MTALMLALHLTASDGPAVAPPPREGADAPPLEVVRVLGSIRFRTRDGGDPTVSPDGRRLAARADDGVQVYDLQTGRVVWGVQFPFERRLDTTTPQFLPDGGLVVLAVRGEVATVHRFDATGQAAGRLVLAARGEHYWKLSGDGSRAAALTCPAMNAARVFDARTGAEVGTVRLPNKSEGGYQFALSVDGRRVAVPDGDAVRVYDTGTAAVLDAWTVPGHGSMRLLFTPDGRRVVYVVPRYQSDQLTGNDLVVREVGTWREIARVECSPPAISFTTPSVSPNGKFVATADADGASLRDLETGRVVRQFARPSGVSALAFSPDGQTLAGGGSGGPVYLWDVTGTRARTGPAEYVPPPPDAAAVRVAVTDLTTTDPWVATEALRVLHAAPAEAVTAIRAMVKPAAGAADLAGVRAVGVLARIGTPEAVAGLRELAGGAAEAAQTQAAADALRWLGK